MGINPYDSTVKTGYAVSNTAVAAADINSKDNEILTPPSTLAV